MANFNAGAPALSIKSTGQSYTPALVSLAVLYFMMGFITCLNDSLIPFFKREFQLSYAQSSLVQFYFFLTYGVSSVPAGKLVERIGYKNGMVAGFFMAALGAFLFLPASYLHQYPVFLAALFILAIGIVLLQVAANPYITVLGPAKTASSRFTLIQGVGSIGATVAPLFGAYFILSGAATAAAGSEAVRAPYIGIGLLLLLIALTVFRLKLPEVGMSKKDSPDRAKDAQADESSDSNAQADENSDNDALAKRSSDRDALADKMPVSAAQAERSVFAFRNLRFGVWAIFCYVGAEVAIGSFLTNYIADTLKVAEESANGFVAFYWGGMIVGRLLGGFILRIVRPPLLLLICAVMAMVMICVSLLSAGYLAVWSMVAVGLFNAIMFATIFSLSVRQLGRLTTRASGYLSTAIVGGAIISYSQGYIIDHFGWQVSFLLPLACYLYIAYYGFEGHLPSRPGRQDQSLHG